MKFYSQDLSNDTFWRSIILFGRNVASYKFALGKTLLELAANEKTKVSLEELAPIYSRAICEHIKRNPKQGTFKNSKFLKSCEEFNKGLISQDALVDRTVKIGFNNVIDAFHVVNSGEIPVRFFMTKEVMGQE